MQKIEMKHKSSNWKSIIFGVGLFIFVFATSLILLRSYHDGKPAREAKNIFTKNKPSHQILSKILMSSYHSGEAEPVKDLSKQYHEELNKNPQESFNDIREGLAAMPVENHYFDRAALLFSAAQLKVDRKQINELAWSEFNKVKLDPKASQINFNEGRPSNEQVESFNRASEQAVLPITAAAIMIGSGDSPLEIMKQLIAGLHIQENPEIRKTIISIFESKYPSMSLVFQTLLKKEGLVVAAN